MSLRKTVLTLGLYKGSGGPSKSVRAMQRALGADVISWVDPKQYASDPLIWEETEVVKGSGLPVLRQLLLPERGATTGAEGIVAESALVSCHSPWRCHMQWLSRIHRKYGMPYWFVPHGGLDPYVFEEQALLKKAFLRFGGRRCIEEAACVIFTAKAERDKALQVCQPRRSEVVYWPLDDADFKIERTDEARARVRAKLGIPESARVLLYFGRLDPMKRPLETIQALAASGTEAHLILVGNEFGVSLEGCRVKADGLGIGGRVHPVGPVYGPAKADYFAAADAYISLSRRENFNFTAAESMASGLPPILSPGNDLGGELEGADCAWLLRDDSKETASEAIRQWTSAESQELEAMGRRGRQWAEAHLRYATFEKKIQSLAEELGRGP